MALDGYISQVKTPDDKLYGINAHYLVDSVAPSTYKLRYINSNDNTTWTTSTLAATDSIAVIRANVTDAWTTGHIVTFNVKSVGTPFQIGVHDSNELYLYKRYRTASSPETWSGWTKMNAGYADSAGTATSATTATNANNVYHTLTNPTTETLYSIPFFSTSSSGNKAMLTNDGLSYRTLEGTTSATGFGLIQLGNAVSTGTAGNKIGYVRMYGAGSGFTQISTGATARRDVSFPDKGGTVAMTSDIPAVSGVYVPIIGKLSDGFNFTYTNIATYYSGGTTPTYVRITLPDIVKTNWIMLNMKIFVRSEYQKSSGGTILINCYHGNGDAAQPWSASSNAFCYGDLGPIYVYGANGNMLYISGIGNYTTVTIEKMIVGDTARSFDLSGTTIDYVTSLPDTRQTFTMKHTSSSVSIGAIQTGSSKVAKISLSTLMTWLITTKNYIPNDKYCSVTLFTSWAYADNDVLQFTVDGTNYEMKLAGVVIEFFGKTTGYDSGMFRLRIHNAPAQDNWTVASGYTKFPTSYIAEYTCNGSSYAPVWKMITYSDKKVTQTADNSSNSDNYELLISNSANNTTETTGVRKSSRLRFNPSTGRVIMHGPLIIRATDGAGSYDEGIRINAGKTGYSSLSFGGGQDTISGTADGQFWVGTNSTNASYKRKLYIAHAGSTNSGTYFYVSSASQVSPALKLGTSGAVANGDGDAVSGGVVYTALSSYLPLSGGRMTGIIKRQAGGNWVSARDFVIVYSNPDSATGNTWYPFGGGKSKTGFWSIGVLGSGDALYFSWSSDTNYSSSTNETSNWYISTSGAFSGTATNVTGTVAIANGGTGATTRLNALKNLTNENVGTNAQYFLTITDSWGKGGFTSIADARAVLGLNTGTTNKLAYYSGANAISSTPQVGYYEIDSTASTPVSRKILDIRGAGVGNTAAQLISGTVGLLTYGDGGPQINFGCGASISTSSSQEGALIFTDHDLAAAGVSWHFVSNQTDWNVISKRFHARNSISIGTNLPNTSYNLYVNGTTNITGNTTIGGTLQTNITSATAGVNANTANSSTAGGLSLYSTNPDQYGIIFRGTSQKGKHGYVTSDWATYFTMNNSDSRGWIFNKQSNVASISGAGNAVFNGSVTVGGNAENTSGCRLTYNSTTQSLDFVFA